MMGLSWGTLAGCFMGPFVLGLLSKRITLPAVWSSIIGSLLLTFTLIPVLGYNHPSGAATLGAAIKNGISCSPTIGVCCMIFSLVITFAVSLFTKAPKAAVLEAAFDAPLENEI